MNSNGHEGTIEIAIEQKPDEKKEVSEGEIEVHVQEPNPYKKVKLNEEQPNKKKHDHDNEKKSKDHDEKREHKHKHKEGSKDHRSDKDEKKESKKKSEKSSEHKSSRKDKSKDDGEKKHSSKSEHRKSSKDGDSKSKDRDEKKREKSKSEKEHKEKKEKKRSKHKDKKKDKDDDKQLKLDAMIEANEEKKHRHKSKDDSERKFLDFSRKYPQFVSKGRFKFPIEDRLFILYGPLLSEHIPKHKKPSPKKGFIPPNHLGDILQIWNFFNSYADLFKFEDINKEEIYAGLRYDGDRPVMLLHDMHQGLMAIFAHEFIKKHRFETQKDEIEYPFFILVKHIIGEREPEGDDIALIWTEFARRLVNLQWFRDLFSLTSRKYMDILTESTLVNYNKCEYKLKTKILIDLIECVHETERFHDFLQAKMEESTTMQKQKNELIAELKADEQEYYTLKFKLEGFIKNEKKHKETNETDKKEMQKNLAAIDESMAEKRARLEEITSGLGPNIQTAQCIGLDCNKSEYWVFNLEPTRIYVRLPAIMQDKETEDNWYYFDKESELEQLKKSLNSKGIREKNLLDNLKNMIENGQISFVDEDGHKKKENGEKDDENLEDIKPLDDLREGKIKEEGIKKDKNVAEKTHDLAFWIERVFEYEIPPEDDCNDGVRTTRRRNPYKNDKKQKKIEFLDIEHIKNMILSTEEGMTLYLNKWNARWASPKVKEKLVSDLLACKVPKEFGPILKRFNECFQYSETVIHRKRYQRDNPDEANNEEDDEEDDVSEEEENNEEKEDRGDREDREEGDEDNENEEKKSNHDDEFYYGEDSPGIKKKEKGDQIIRKDKRKLVIDDDERSSQENDGDVKREVKEEDEDNDETPSENGDKAHDEEKGIDEERDPKIEEKVEEGEEKRNANPQIIEEEDESGVRVKKVALRIWGLSNEKVKRCWLNFLNQLDTISSLYFATSVFCDFVDKYVAKKTAHYFSTYTNAREYFAAKRAAKRAQALQKKAIQTHHEPKTSTKMNIEKLENYKMKKSVYRENRDRERKKEAAAVKASSISGRLRERNNAPMVDDFEYTPKADEKSRAKQEKLHELLNLRRSDRVTRGNRKNLTEEWDNECKTCGDTGEAEDMCSCSICNQIHHLECLGLKKIPEGGWTCVDCLQKLASQRQTRSTTRKLHN